MSDVTFTAQRPTQRPGVEGNGSGRPLRRRQSLPGGRAVVGGFLIAAAAVGIFAAYTGATADNRQGFLVARRDLPIGHRIQTADLGPLPMDLPPDVRARASREPSRLVGSVVIGPVAKGELVQASDVAPGSAAGDLGLQVSFPIESARALDGGLEIGELVDVVATYDAAGTGQTLLVARGARVVNRSKPPSTLGEGGQEVVTLSLPTQSDTLAVTHAANAGEITLVRMTGQPKGAANAASYRAPAPASTQPSPG
ncbi:MAG: SAF domain-containing protein [Actinomycetota bacterium]|nr:SAF domain-containing protein [Actinomycetota bacterium]